MKVLIIANKYPFPPRDGSSIAILSSLRMWQRMGYEVSLFALNPKKSEVPADVLPADLSEKTFTHTFSINTDVTPLGAAKNLVGKRPYHISRFLNPDIADALKRLTTEKNYDFVQWEGPFMGEYLPFVQGQAQHIMRAHNIEHRIWLRVAKHTKNPIIKRYLRLQANRLMRFEDQFTRKMNAVLPITDVDAQYFKKKFPHIPCHVVLPGVDVEQYPRWKDGGNTAVSLASFDWEPNREGMEWFINEVKPLLSVDVKGQIGGRQMPAHWTSTGNWDVIGDVDNAHDFLLNGRLQFIPLLSGSGIRIKIVEAMSMGMPVVATEIAAEGSGLTPGVHYLEGNKAESFAEAVNALYNNPQERQRLSENAISFAQTHYNLNTIAEELLRFTKQL